MTGSARTTAIAVGAVTFVVGLVVGAMFTVSERTELKTQTRSLESRLVEAERRGQESATALKSEQETVVRLRGDLTSTRSRLATTKATLGESQRKLEQQEQQAQVIGPPPPPVDDPTVYVTKSGGKYHRVGCQYLRRSSIAKKLSQARGRYGPCSRCGPPS